MRSPTLRRLAACALLPGVLLLAGCSGYADKVDRLRTELAAGQPERALATLAEINGENPDADLPYLMERGTLLYLNGDYADCQASFAEAERVVEDLYTKSISREIGRLLINDATQEYRGELYERVWIHYYRALAYLATDERQSAAVEGRAAIEDLRRLADEGSDEAKYRNDPFLQYFSGLLYELDGEPNDAWIAYVQAERLYRAGDVYGVTAPPTLIADLIRTGQRLGFHEEVARYRDAYGDIDVPRPAGGEGELVLLVDTGLVPGKVSQRLDFPIYEGTAEDEEHVWDIAGGAYDNWRYRSSRDLELDYILSIALPAVEPEPPAPRLSWSLADGPGAAGTLAPAADLGALHRQCLEDRYGGVVIRTVARALLKYWAKEKVEEKHGKGWAFVTDILGSVTEVADTRSWSTLPAHVEIARFPLSAGEHAISVRGDGHAGQGRVLIEPGKLSILALRLY